MLPIRGEKTYKEGAVATIAVYDRRGRRLGRVMGQMPEACRHRSTELTRLLTEVLREWSVLAASGLRHRCGISSHRRFENVLTRLDDPRHLAGD